MLQVVASPMIVILMTLEVSFMLLANIYSRGVTHDDCHVMIVIYLSNPQTKVIESNVLPLSHLHFPFITENIRLR